MLSELKAQVTNLDRSKYKVMLVWDPENARDVGWLTVEKGFKVDLEVLQVRDINLDKVISCFNCERSEPNNEVEVNTADSSSKLSQGEVNEDVIVIDDEDAIKDNLIQVKDLNQHFACSVDPIKNKVKCPECQNYLTRGYFLEHMARIHGRIIKDEKVNCAICGAHVHKMYLNFHKKHKHGIGNEASVNMNIENKTAACFDCGKVFKSNKSLYSHRRWCIKSNKSPLPMNKDKDSTNKKVATKRNSVGEGVLEKSTVGPDVTETSDISSKNERACFSILYENCHYSCSRSKGGQIKSSLKKFCKHVGKDLKFEYQGRLLTGEEIVDSFSGSTLKAVFS